jgi:hypothetical protein
MRRDHWKEMRARRRETAGMDVKLETYDRRLVGWSHVGLADPPSVLFWGTRCFRYRGLFQRGAAAQPHDPRDHWLYSEETPFALVEVTAERPA